MLQELRRHGIEHILLNGPTGSREHLRRFARDIIPAFSFTWHGLDYEYTSKNLDDGGAALLANRFGEDE
mgnify:CR=1 FL=1